MVEAAEANGIPKRIIPVQEAKFNADTEAYWENLYKQVRSAEYISHSKSLIHGSFTVPTRVSVDHEGEQWRLPSVNEVLNFCHASRDTVPQDVRVVGAELHSIVGLADLCCFIPFLCTKTVCDTEMRLDPNF